MNDTILRKKKLRVTPFRKEVLKVFLKNDHAISMQDIENELGDFDRITLYRTIKSFINKGVIHEIVMPGDIRKMALCDQVCDHDSGLHDHNHIHFQCKKCEEVFCVEIDKIPEIKIPGFQIEEQEIQAKGICEKCSGS
ncbi:Fur family transcriptional regulator [Brumimicrobium aurantiacum]|uniref:Transcriptional repressor n=1 Tax=Brumimicrobium aurantiacum TaxID=1737063 RepID=A0A3E1F1D5_9FLAO|nr:transcriptional repressor [Brumimicrobium aurantiacum]RFC55620.1 transcriptional repressor [Brumimicrobium aurantiacum]